MEGKQSLLGFVLFCILHWQWEYQPLQFVYSQTSPCAKYAFRARTRGSETLHSAIMQEKDSPCFHIQSMVWLSKPGNGSYSAVFELFISTINGSYMFVHSYRQELTLIGKSEFELSIAKTDGCILQYKVHTTRCTLQDPQFCNKIWYPCIFCVDIIFYFCWKGVDIIFLQKEFYHFACFGWSEPLIFHDREIRLITSISEGHGLNLQDWINMQMFYCTLSFLGLNWMQSKGRDEVMRGMKSWWDVFALDWQIKAHPD